MALTVDAGGYIGNGKPLMVLSDKADGLAVMMFKVTFDASYPTGGESLDLRPYFSTVLGVFVEASTVNTYTYDYTNRKIVATVAATGAEVANTTDLSAVTVAVFAFGVAALDKV